MKKVILFLMIMFAICFAWAVEACNIDGIQEEQRLYISDSTEEIDNIYMKIVETMNDFPEGYIKGVPIRQDVPGWRLLDEKIKENGNKYDIWTLEIKAGAFLMIRKK